MKPLLLIAGLLFGSRVLAAPTVVFSKVEIVELDSGKTVDAPNDPAKAAFVAAVKHDLGHPAPFASPFKLSSPPEWGRTVPGSSGKIEFHDRFPGGFFVRVNLEGLTPDHRYRLTLNGNPKLAGNDRLADPVPGLPAERYFDFFTATTDAKGNYQGTFGIALSPGPYDVRFYVKDTDDFKIVLYHDYFKFTVE